MALGGFTNAALHLIVIARSVGLDSTLDDFLKVSDKVPFLADLKPSGKYLMEDVHKIGGTLGASLPIGEERQALFSFKGVMDDLPVGFLLG